MTKEMIISSNDHETRVAILEDDLVSEMFVERERTRGVVGNVYKGRVSKVLPGMQSSFVDVGLERDGFLYVTDVVEPRGVRQARLDEDEAEEPKDAGGRAQRSEGPGARGTARARGRDGARRPRGGRASRTCSARGRRSSSRWPRSRSAPRARASRPTCRLPGRFLVFMPTVDHVGVSRKIDSREERGAPARHRPRVPRAAGLHRRRSSSAPRPWGARRTTSSATSSTSTRSGRRSAARPSRRARRASSTARRAWSPSSCATC